MIAPANGHKTRILDANGNPFSLAASPRKELAESLNRFQRRQIEARYDAAQDTDEFKNYWEAADSLDADCANSRTVREKLVQRSRYEVASNGYTDGMVQTHANYLVGIGPQLQMQTKSPAFNELVELRWRTWADAVQLRRKLWCQAHAKVQDGEGFGIAVTNPAIADLVKLDYMLIETEQCQSPWLPFDIAGQIDGIRFDEFGNPIWYEILRTHPGSDNVSFARVADRVPAEFVFHWFKLRRPGQHRAVPEFRSTLNTGAGSRRFREATIAAAETAADYTTLLKTQLTPDMITDEVSPLSEIEIQKRMMVALPMGWDASQMRAEHPNASYREFLKSQITEQGRPKSMPANVSSADHSDHNFTSGKLGMGPWFAEIKCEREDANDLVLDPMFSQWWREASMVYGWQGDRPPHAWDWPVLPVADEKARSLARNVDLQNGSTTLSEVYSEQGKDFEDALKVMTMDYFGDTSPESISQMRAVLLNRNLGVNAPAIVTITDTDEAESVNQNAT